MSIIYKHSNITNIILRSKNKNLQEVINQFLDCGLKKITYWHHLQILLMECTENDKINKAFNNYTDLPYLKNLSQIDQISNNNFYDNLIHRGLFTEIDKSSKALENFILNASSLSEQMILFYKFYRISEDDLKLRKCYANFIKSILQNRYNSNLDIEFIGSTTNGLGKFNSDLDMGIIKNNTDSQNLEILLKLKHDLRNKFSYKVKPDVFRCKFPICNYFDGLLDINIDISVYNDNKTIAFEINRILRYICECCDYFAPLCMFIKQIYLSQSIIHERPGQSFTGFKIVSLIISFLQQQKLLPGLENIDLIKKTVNQPKLEILLIDFYQFIIDFKPDLFIIDLGEGQIKLNNANKAFIWCHCHLDPTQNITRNIGRKHWDYFVDITRNIQSQIKSNSSCFNSSQLTEIC